MRSSISTTRQMAIFLFIAIIMPLQLIAAELPPVQITTTTPPAYYQTLQEAYNAAQNNAVIKSRDKSFNNLIINRNIAVTFQGGYNADFSAVVGNTYVNEFVNVSSGSVSIGNFILDSQPKVIIASPAGITNNSSPLLQYTSCCGPVIVRVDNGVVSTVSGQILSTLEDGPHVVRIETADIAGNPVSSQATFSVDTVAPVVSVSSPADGSIISTSRNPLLSYSVSDGSVVVTIDGNVVNKVSGNSLDALADGSHTVRVEATDAAGNKSFAENRFTVAVPVGPTGAISIRNGAVATNSQYVYLTLGCTISRGTCSRMQIAEAVSGHAPEWRSSLPEAYVSSKPWTLSPRDGLKTLYIKFSENNNVWNVTPYSASIMVDTTIPVVSISSPQAVVQGTSVQLLSYTVSEGNAAVKIDNSEVDKRSGDLIGPLPDGEHTVRVEAKDQAGNTGYAEVRFSVSASAGPYVAITSPTPGTITTKTPLLTYKASEGTVIVRVDGKAVSKVSGNTLDWLAAGGHNISVEVIDSNGYRGSAQVAFTVPPDADDLNPACNGSAAFIVGASNFWNGVVIPVENNAIMISSPGNQQVVNGPRIIVKGAMDATVPVMGVSVKVDNASGISTYPAQVNGRYFAAQIPIVANNNYITVTAVDQNSVSHQDSVSIFGVVQQDEVKLTAGPSIGVPILRQGGPASLDVRLSSTTSLANIITSYDWDFTGSGNSQLNCTGHANITARYQQPGLYLTQVKVRDASGAVASDMAIVNVVDRNAMDSIFKPIWSGMKDALNRKDIAAALNYIASDSKQTYQQQFTVLSSSLPQIAASFGDINAVSISQNFAEYDFRVIRNGQTYSFQLLFARDKDGSWKIISF